MFAKSGLLPFIMCFTMGLWSGLFWYVLGMIVYYQMMRIAFKMERLSAMDEFFLLDQPKNRANIITVVKVDKIGSRYNEVRNYVI